jgi:hypothetical protein
VIDVGEYCRQVEDYLTRVNGGHLVRVVGPGFELVRAWAHEAIPLSVVFRGIEQKADRHRSGSATRPLRIEFCEPDVRTLYASWRRAVGVPAHEPAEAGEDADEGAKSTSLDRSRPGRRPSLSKHLDRAIDRLARIVGRLDYPESFRDAVSRILEQLTSLRESGRNTRGEARDALIQQLAPLDDELMHAVRSAAPADVLPEIVREAEGDLGAFRGRLSGPAWEHAVAVTVDSLLRTRYELPTIQWDGT